MLLDYFYPTAPLSATAAAARYPIAFAPTMIAAPATAGMP